MRTFERDERHSEELREAMRPVAVAYDEAVTHLPKAHPEYPVLVMARAQARRVAGLDPAESGRGSRAVSRPRLR
jgi:hypothetical protein